MLSQLFDDAAAEGLSAGLRIAPPAEGAYQILLWIGPREGERYEWARRFPIATPKQDALAALAADAYGYCQRHGGWGRLWLAPPCDNMIEETA